MTSLSNAPSRLTFPLPSTTVQTQRTGRLRDSNFFYGDPLLKNHVELFSGFWQSDYDQRGVWEIVKMILEKIAEGTPPDMQRTLLIHYDEKYPSKQLLEDYLKWLNALSYMLNRNEIPHAIETMKKDPKKILRLDFSKIPINKLHSLKQLLSENLLLI
jgi:hypothetical protein